jgi:hypothetical protein
MKILMSIMTQTKTSKWKCRWKHTTSYDENVTSSKTLQLIHRRKKTSINNYWQEDIEINVAMINKHFHIHKKIRLKNLQRRMKFILLQNS